MIAIGDLLAPTWPRSPPSRARTTRLRRCVERSSSTASSLEATAAHPVDPHPGEDAGPTGPPVTKPRPTSSGSSFMPVPTGCCGCCAAALLLARNAVRHAAAADRQDRRSRRRAEATSPNFISIRAIPISGSSGSRSSFRSPTSATPATYPLVFQPPCNTIARTTTRTIILT